MLKHLCFASMRKIPIKTLKTIKLQKFTEFLFFIKTKINSYSSSHVALIPLLGFSGRENRVFVSRKPRITHATGSRAKKNFQKYEYEFKTSIYSRSTKEKLLYLWSEALRVPARPRYAGSQDCQRRQSSSSIHTNKVCSLTHKDGEESTTSVLALSRTLGWDWKEK